MAIMDRLRDPGGCPWDHEQDYRSLRRYLLEECYEVVEALDHGSPAELREELGDLLFQIVFLSRLAKEDGSFTIDDVIRGVAEKLIRRHPHVFGSARATTSEEVAEQWERIKREEKKSVSGEPVSALDGIGSALPALLKAHALGQRAARVGFDWKRPEQVLDQIEEELGELRRALAEGAESDIRDEIGDLLFSVAMLSRWMKIDPEEALSGTNAKFRARFTWIERELVRRETPLESAGFELLESLWGEAKRHS